MFRLDTWTGGPTSGPKYDNLYPAADDDTGEEAESDDGTWNAFELHDCGLTIFKDMVRNAKYNKATRRAFQDAMYSGQAQVLAALAREQPKKRAPKRAPSPAGTRENRMASSNLESERCHEPIRIHAKGSAEKKKRR
jgi:hypothetical protein